MIDPSAPYSASFQHIQLVSDKRERLITAQLDAENQVLHRIATDYRAGRITKDDLCEIWLEFREIAMSGYSKRWKAAMPEASVGHLHAYLKRRETDHLYAPDDDGNWRGEYPIPVNHPYPRTGTNVVYVLYDADNVPCYVGSTKKFHTRLTHHARDGKVFVRWLAYPCKSRADAYALESRLLRERKPYLNKRT